jgi:hypothetical protein
VQGRQVNANRGGERTGDSRIDAALLVVLLLFASLRLSLDDARSLARRGNMWKISEGILN